MSIWLSDLRFLTTLFYLKNFQIIYSAKLNKCLEKALKHCVNKLKKFNHLVKIININNNNTYKTINGIINVKLSLNDFAMEGNDY